MAMQAPALSFVIPAYNDAPGVQRHLAYFAKAPQPVELIVVDDGSSDGLDQVIANADLPDHVTLTYHRNAKNLGPGPTRNVGIDLARHEHLMFLDADDLLVPDFFDYIALARLEQSGDFILFQYHLCRGQDPEQTYEMLAPDGQFFAEFAPCGFPGQSFALSQAPGAIKTINFPWNKIYRTDFLRGANIRFPALKVHEDIRPNWQGFLRAKRFGILNWAPPLVYHFEAHEGARATHYIGPERTAAFETLAEVYQELRAHPLAKDLTPELEAFTADLLRWMTERAPDLSDMLTASAKTLYARIDADRPQSATPQTPREKVRRLLNRGRANP